eukprot:3990985-Pleurochrysis_carterae.AAC.1
MEGEGGDGGEHACGAPVANDAGVVDERARRGAAEHAVGHGDAEADEQDGRHVQRHRRRRQRCRRARPRQQPER